MNTKIIQLVLVILSLIFFGDIYRFLAYNSPDTTSENIHIARGTPVSTIAENLKEKNYISNSFYWKILAVITNKSSKIQAGEYHFPPNSSPLSVLNTLVKGKTVLSSITFLEGWTFDRAHKALIDKAEVDQTIPASEEFLFSLNGALQHPEGWCYPDTYKFSKGTTDRELLDLCHQSMVKALNKACDNRTIFDVYKNKYEALIMASIVEKETSQKNEKPIVAGVFIRRLAENMKLQADPTVIYGLGKEFKGNITKKHLKQDTIYNTYLHKGLPPTPISMPGIDSINAALNPIITDALYFVSKGDGTHYFSDTYTEHKQAVKKFQLKR